VLDGAATAPFDPARQYAREQAIFGQATPFYGWHYPPFFLGLAALLALMPYALALALWQGATLVLYVLCMRTILLIPPPPVGEGGQRSWPGGGKSRSNQLTPPDSTLRVEPPSPFRGGIENFWLLFAVAFPAVFINLGHGHNGFLTAALLGTALVMLVERPILAGVLIGCLAYKPQFGLLIPLVLIAGSHWRAFISAAATVAVLTLAVTLASAPRCGAPSCVDQIHARRGARAGDTGWHKIQSVFSWVRMWGGGVALAYAAQAAVTLALASALVWLWRSRAAFPLKAAALLIGTLLATP